MIMIIIIIIKWYRDLVFSNIRTHIFEKKIYYICIWSHSIQLWVSKSRLTKTGIYDHVFFWYVAKNASCGCVEYKLQIANYFNQLESIQHSCLQLTFCNLRKSQFTKKIKNILQLFLFSSIYIIYSFSWEFMQDKNEVSLKKWIIMKLMCP